MSVIREFFGAIRDFVGSTAHVSNFLALFFAISLVGLLAYTVVARENLATGVIGFSSAIIGTITGLYFNKDRLNAVQREEQTQERRASSYIDQLERLESELDSLTTRYDELIELLEQDDTEH